MNLESRYRAACERTDVARGRLRLTADDAKARIAPARLKQDAKDGIGNAVSSSLSNIKATALERPAAAGAAVTALSLFLFRRPLTALFGRLYVRFRDRHTDIPETDDG